MQVVQDILNKPELTMTDYYQLCSLEGDFTKYIELAEWCLRKEGKFVEQCDISKRDLIIFLVNRQIQEEIKIAERLDIESIWKARTFTESYNRKDEMFYDDVTNYSYRAKRDYDNFKNAILFTNFQIHKDKTKQLMIDIRNHFLKKHFMMKSPFYKSEYKRFKNLYEIYYLKEIKKRRNVLKNCYLDKSVKDVYFNVPYSKKDIAKKNGARWCYKKKMWYGDSIRSIKKLDKLFTRSI